MEISAAHAPGGARALTSFRITRRRFTFTFTFTTPMGDVRPGDGLTIRQLLRVLRKQVTSVLFVDSHLTMKGFSGQN